MKYLVSCLVWLIVIFHSIEISAQPSLTRSIHQPVIGDIELRYQYVDTIPVSPGPAGLNVTWDFSNLNFNPTPDTIWYEPMINHFGMSGNIVSRRNISLMGLPFMYYDVFGIGVGHTAYRGWALLPYGPDFPYADLHNPAIIHNYPMTYSDSLVDPFSGVQWGLGGLSVSGDQIAVIDGQGTLILPTGTHTDVLRLHVYPANGGNSNVVWGGYYFYSATDRFPLIAFAETPYSPPPSSTPNIYTATALNINVAQTPAGPGPSIQLAPNPTSGLVTLQVEGLQNESLKWKVYDQQGKVIFGGNEPNLQSQLRETIDLTEQPIGVYLVEFLIGEIRITRRIAKL